MASNLEKIKINIATEEQLQKLAGVGKMRKAHIEGWTEIVSPLHSYKRYVYQMGVRVLIKGKREKASLSLWKNVRK